MFDKIKVFDDAVPEYLQNYFCMQIFGRSSEGEIFPTIDFRVKYESTGKEENFDPISFTHVLKSSTQQSQHLENFSILPRIACAKINKTLQQIILGRIFLIMPYKTQRSTMDPHTDFDFNHTVVLYYVNDSEGDTVFYNNQNQIIKSVTPKKGRLVVFDGLTLHSGGIPTENPRCAVNFDIITEKND
mgnify:CR=1 FL=1